MNIVTRFRVVLLVALGVATVSFQTVKAQGAAYRCLIVMETSRAMKAQRDVGIETVNRLILHGLPGHLQPGDTIGVWGFNENLLMNLHSPTEWSSNPADNSLFARQVYRALRDAEYTGSADISRLMAGINGVVQGGRDLTLFLVLTGRDSIRGTPFDAEINAVFSRHGEAMRKENQPFILALLARDGKFATQAISPGGRATYIPKLEPSPSNSTTNEVVAASEQLVSPEPELTTSSATDTSVSPQESTTEVVNQEATVAKPEPMSDEEVNRMVAEQMQEARAARAASNTVAAATAETTKPPQEGDDPAADAEDVPSVPVPDPETEPAVMVMADSEVAPRVNSESIEALAKSAQPELASHQTAQAPPADIAPKDSESSTFSSLFSWLDMGIGVALGFVLAALGWLVFMRPRTHADTSFISKSYDRISSDNDDF